MATEQFKKLTKEERLKTLNSALKEVNSYSKDMPQIDFMPNIREEVTTFSSGSLVLDSILGGGIPRGRVIEIHGKEASGKTSIALNAAGNVQKEGGYVAFIDAEQAFDPNYARKLGVDVNQLLFTQSSFAEDALTQVYLLAKSGAFDLIILDSIAALTPKAEDEDLEKQQMALLARLLSKSIRRIIAVANETDTTVIFINQLRANVGQMFGPATTTAGGNALKYFASQRIEVNRKSQVKDGDEVIGTEVKLKVVKNKVSAPYGEGVTVLTFAEGINRAAETALIAEEIGIITKTGRTYRYTPSNKFGVDKDGNILKVELDPEGKAVYEDDNTIKITGMSAKACIDEIKSNKPLSDAINKEIKIAIHQKMTTGSYELKD